MPKPLEPVDRERCQADVPGPGPFTVGGEIGDPRNGYRVRCKNKPTVIATENQPGEDGRIGSMSLCRDCVVVFVRDLGVGYATLRDIMDPDKNLQEQLELAKHIQDQYDEEGGNGIDQDDANQLAELVMSLHEWIKKGGFLPTEWNRGGVSPELLEGHEDEVTDLLLEMKD